MTHTEQVCFNWAVSRKFGILRKIPETKQKDLTFYIFSLVPQPSIWDPSQNSNDQQHIMAAEFEPRGL